MLELVGVVITAVVGLFSAKGWPSLRHRIRGHAALIKDLPPDVSIPLLGLLQREVAVLARQDARHLHPIVGPWLRIERVVHTAAISGVAFSVAAFVLTVNGYDKESPGVHQIGGWLTGLGLVAAAISTIAGARSRWLTKQYVEEHRELQFAYGCAKDEAEQLKASMAEGSIDSDTARAAVHRLQQDLLKLNDQATYGLSARTTS